LTCIRITANDDGNKPKSGKFDGNTTKYLLSAVEDSSPRSASEVNHIAFSIRVANSQTYDKEIQFRTANAPASEWF